MTPFAIRTGLTLATLLFAASGCAATTPANAPVPPSAPVAKESPAQKAARLQWFTDARFGLFIHWGVYSMLGDDYAGKRWTKAEQIQWEAHIPNAEYAKIAETFNPVKFDAREIARTAKAAGMKYIVITGKHHDGLAMFKSPSNPFNIVDATAFKRDPIKELAEACREAGLKFCVYYSLGRDWKEPDVRASKENTWDFPGKKTGDLSAYIERKVKPHIRELLTQYGPIDAIWFDTPELTRAKHSDELYALIRSLQPDCLVNARVGNGRGDYDLTEQTVPAAAVKSGKPFEACLTMNKHWGFDKFDHDWKSTDTLLRILVDVASKGGNTLLNVGPTGEGEIPAPSVERLLAMGEWLRVNGEAVYGTGRTAFGYEYAGTPKPGNAGVDAMGQEIKGAKVGDVGHGIATPKGWRCTTKPGAIYIHLFDWPGKEFSLFRVPGKIDRAVFLADGKPVAFTAEGDTLKLALPEKAPAPGIVVIKLETAK